MATAMEPRRKPKQQRSAFMVDVILTATEEVLATEGAERLTAERIAERAGVGIGSLYQYFPNKKAIVGTLIGEAQARRRMAIEVAVQESADLDFGPAVVHLATAAARDHAHRERLRSVLNNDDMAPLRDGVIAAENARVRAAIGTFVQRYWSDTPSEQIEALARDLVVMARALFEAPDAASGRTPEMLQQAIERMIGGYLSWRG